MVWVAEGVLNRNQPWQNWKPKFFALRGSDVYIFESPPIEAGDWSNHSGNLQAYPIHQAMFRVIKGQIMSQCIQEIIYFPKYLPPKNMIDYFCPGSFYRLGTCDLF